MKDHPNIILIQVDQWRGDCLSIEGHPVVHTPYLDQLASRGVRFRRAYSSTPVCIPARAALMTGLSSRSHGRVGYEDGVPWNYPVTLAGEFTRHGYRTHAIGKLHAFPERNSLGFQTVELHDGYLHHGRNRRRFDPGHVDDYLTWLRTETGREDADFFEHGVNCNSIVARPWDKEERLHPTNWVMQRALQFLATHEAGRPFFLYLSFHRPHPPYDPPAWAFDLYRDAPMPSPPVGDWAERYARFDVSACPEAFRAQYRADIVQRARAGYYGHMTHIDHQINRLMETLHEYRLRENVYVCFTSDHGEMLGDHHLFRKGYPYEGSARVPLILAGPKDSDLPRGEVSDVVVEQRDIMPTLLDCAGLPVPSAVEGRSFLGAARGESAPLRPWLHGEMSFLGQSIQWLTDGFEKYVWMSEDGHEQLFDLCKDPDERHDLAAAQTSGNRLAVWRSRLVSELGNRPEGYVSNGELVTGRPARLTLPAAYALPPVPNEVG